MLAYGLRAGREPAVPNRLVPGPRASRVVLIYALAAVAFHGGVLSYGWAGYSRPRTRSSCAASGTAIASLRGLAAALLIVSVALDLRLRALRLPFVRADR